MILTMRPGHGRGWGRSNDAKVLQGRAMRPVRADMVAQGLDRSSPVSLPVCARLVLRQSDALSVDRLAFPSGMPGLRSPNNRPLWV